MSWGAIAVWAMAGLQLVIALVYLLTRDHARAAYWVLAAAINVSTLFLH